MWDRRYEAKCFKETQRKELAAASRPRQLYSQKKHSLTIAQQFG
jgi:hypothetical protein